MRRVCIESYEKIVEQAKSNRCCISRIAGARIDENGLVEETFIKNYVTLSQEAKLRCINVLSDIMLSKPETEFREYEFPKDKQRLESTWNFFNELTCNDLKKEQLLDVLYDVVGGHYKPKKPYTIFFLFGSYETDSEEKTGKKSAVKFTVCAISKTDKNYRAGRPEFGFVFPAIKEDTGDPTCIDIFEGEAENTHDGLMKLLFA